MKSEYTINMSVDYILQPTLLRHIKSTLLYPLFEQRQKTALLVADGILCEGMV